MTLSLAIPIGKWPRVQGHDGPTVVPLAFCAMCERYGLRVWTFAAYDDVPTCLNHALGLEAGTRKQAEAKAALETLTRNKNRRRKR